MCAVNHKRKRLQFLIISSRCCHWIRCVYDNTNDSVSLIFRVFHSKRFPIDTYNGLMRYLTRSVIVFKHRKKRIDLVKL